MAAGKQEVGKLIVTLCTCALDREVTRENFMSCLFSHIR